MRHRETGRSNSVRWPVELLRWGLPLWLVITLGTAAFAQVAPPTGLAASDVLGDSGGAISLSWTRSTDPGVTQQRVYRSLITGGPYSLVNTIANNTTETYTDIGLVNGTTYFYVIRAFNGTVESADSNQASAVPVNNLVTYTADNQHNWAWALDASADVAYHSYPRKRTVFSGNEIVAHIKVGGTPLTDYDPVLRLRGNVDIMNAYGSVPVTLFFRNCTAANAGGTACDALYPLPAANLGWKQVAPQNTPYVVAGDPVLRFHESTLDTNGNPLAVLTAAVPSRLQLLQEPTNPNG